MRPLYQTEKDRKVQARVLKIFDTRWGVRSVQTDDTCSFDANVYRSGVPTAIAEVKGRDYLSNQFPTLIISKKKCDENSIIAEEKKVNHLIIVSWTDCIVWISNPDFASYEVTMSGRKDRGDPKDIEPCYNIPIRELTRCAGYDDVKDNYERVLDDERETQQKLLSR